MAKYNFRLEDPLIIVDVRIKTTFEIRTKFILDTGASYTVLSSKLAGALRISTAGAKKHQTTTASGLELAPEIIISELSFLEKTRRRVPALVMDLPKQLVAEGLLGLSFLKHFKLTCDFRQGYLWLE